MEWRSLSLRHVYDTEHSMYLDFNHFYQQVLCSVMLTHCSTVHFFASTSFYIVTSVYSISVYNSKICGRLHSYGEGVQIKQKTVKLSSYLCAKETSLL